MKINLAVTVKGDEVTFDFTGSSPQTPGFVNAPYSATASALLLTFLMLIKPDIPHNAGILRPIRIVNPEGSFLNASFPAATTFGNSITGPTSDAIFRAFGDGVEEEARAFGFFGGKPGSRNAITLRYPDGAERHAKTKEIIRGIPAGTVFHQLAGGGGGYGDPRERPAALVLADVRNGMISVDAARADYGVCIDPKTLSIDEQGTAELRRR